MIMIPKLLLSSRTRPLSLLTRRHSCLRQRSIPKAVVSSSSFYESTRKSTDKTMIRCFSSSSDNNNDTPNAKDNNDPGLRFVSHLKNPIVHQLWTARGHAKAAADGVDSQADKPRSPSVSKVGISYPFSSDPFFKETYRNPWGQMRFGKLLEDLDALAGNIAFAHVQDPTVTLVTASVDRIRLTSTPDLNQDQHLSGNVTYVGSSSMEIRIQCTGEDCQGNVKDDSESWMQAYFTFVATDPETKRPVKIPPLQPETDAEMEQFKAGEKRAAAKKIARKHAKLGTPPENSESINATAKQLLAEAGPLLNMPSLANPDSILVPQTELQNAEIAQPQVRNLANQIFGGFLMRRACELAYATAYVFGGARPIFYEVDQVSFGMPVNVGDLKNFHAKVLHTQYKETLPKGFTSFQNQTNIPLVSIEVEAWIIDPTKPSAKLSNQFYFTFAFPSGTPIRRVLPSNMEEARNVAQRMEAERVQEEDGM